MTHAKPEWLLEVQGLTKRFGGLVAVNGMEYCQEAGSICSIIGPNGAGKTTLFNTLTGLYRPEAGAIRLDGRSLVGLRPDQVAAREIARTFQNIRLFGNMTVLENIMVGMHHRLRQCPLSVLFRSRSFRQEEDEAHHLAQNLMAYVGLKGVGNELANKLPYGGQRRVEIARALAARPRLLLLDEPTAGMNPKETDEAVLLFRRLRDERGITLLLIEHDMRVVMSISDRITVMDYGQKIAEGLPHEIRANPKVIEAYLGRTEAGGA